MRVISGVARGRPLRAVPGNRTRPTSDKVKGAIFSAIGPYYDGGMVLDLFAGTGSLGIEALSRGMTHGVFCDISRQAVKVINHNLQHTGLHELAEVHTVDARRALNALSKRQLTFDLVFIDPPYVSPQSKDGVIDIEQLLTSMQTLNLLREQATIVIEHDRRTTYSDYYGNLKTMKQSEYGDTMVTYYTLIDLGRHLS